MVAVNTRSRRILAKMYGRFYTIHLIVVLSQERSEGKFSVYKTNCDNFGNVGYLSLSIMHKCMFYCTDTPKPPLVSCIPDSRGGRERYQGNCGIENEKST